MACLLGPHNEKFEDFYASWTHKQEELMNQVHEALESGMEEPELKKLVDQVIQHYDYYYEAKDNATQQNILKIITPSWRSPLEKAFLWMGGWRPSMAFQLVYALAGQQTEAQLAQFLEGLDTATFASLSSSQLAKVSELQVATCKEEERLGNEMAMLQLSFADLPVLKTLVHKEQEEIMEARPGDSSSGGGGSAGIGAASHSEHGDPDAGDDMDNAMKEKLETLEELSTQADNLRRNTLKKVLDVLDTVQAGQYLVVAAKLQVALRQFGEKLSGET